MHNNRLHPPSISMSLKIYLYINLLVTCAIFLPSSMERVRFLFLLLIPIIVSYKYFKFETALLKRSVTNMTIFIVANLTTLSLHFYQLKWELSNPAGLFGWKININGWLSQIPYNDGMWLRQFSNPILEEIFVKIYIHGFTLCLFALAFYYLLSGQPQKIIVAMFAGHFLQYILILPFHFWIDGHQVWWLQNIWYGAQLSDPLDGYRTLTEPVIPSINHVFPSMHTSIATVTILLALREQAIAIKYFFAILNGAIIISTVYLGIHWVVDLLGGVLFGVATLKLTDKIMVVDWKLAWRNIYRTELSFPEQQLENKFKRNTSKRFWWI